MLPICRHIPRRNNRDRDSHIVYLVCGCRHTYASVAERYGLTKQRVHQIVQRERSRSAIEVLSRKNPLFLLSARARNALSRRKIHRIEQLEGITREDLLSISGCGVTTADEIIALMAAKEVRLGRWRVWS